MTYSIALLHCNDSLNNAFETVVPTGTGTLDTTNYKFGEGSWYLNGSQYIQIPVSFSGTKYSVECWFNCTVENTTNLYPTLFSTDAVRDTGGTYLHIDDGSYNTKCVCRANASNSSGHNGKYGSTVISRNEWHHFAFCRDGDTNYFFIDGVLQATVTQANPCPTSNIWIGARMGISSLKSDCYYTGYVDEILVVDYCKYTEDFTPPTLSYSTLSVTTSATNGITSPQAINVLSGDSVTISIVPDENCSLAYIQKNGSVIDPDPNYIPYIENGLRLYHLNDDVTDELNYIAATGTGVIDTSTYCFGTGSYYLDGTTYLCIPVDLSSSTTYTIEFWAYTSVTNQKDLFQTIMATSTTNNAGGVYIHVDDGSYSAYPVYRANGTGSSGNTGMYGNTIFTRNEWHHVAFCRDGDTNYFFLDGSLQATVTQTNPNTVTEVYFGGLRQTNGFKKGCYFTGYIDEIMISDACKYTEDFIMPDTEYTPSIIHDHDGYECTITNITEDVVLHAMFSRTIKLYMKSSTGWVEVTKVYYKENGQWVEQSTNDFAFIFSENVRLKQIIL